MPPTLASAYWNDFKPIEYTPMQITNWYWTLSEAADGGIALHPEVLVTVPLAGLVVFLVNVYESSGAFQYVRHALPQRVRQDELQRRHALDQSSDPTLLGVQEST